MKILASVAVFFLLLTQSTLVYAAESVEVEVLQSPVIIFQLKTEGVTASDEYILLYNQTTEDVDLQNWCIAYSSANDNPSFKVCIEEPYVFLAGSYVSFGTSSFAASSNFSLDFIINGGMSSTGGHLRLLTDQDEEADRVGWGTALNPEKESSSIAPAKHLKEQSLSRLVGADILDSNDNFTDFASREVIYQCPVSGILLSGSYYVDQTGLCVERFCPNLPESTTDAPDGYYKPEGKNTCELIPIEPEDSVLYITELYPNAVGTDTGNEFIELYNPNSEAVNLGGYRIQVGPTFTKESVLKEYLLGPDSYVALSDIETGIVLPNTTGVQLRFVSPEGSVVDETTVYANAKESESWSLIGDQWVWTNQITRGSTNKPFLAPVIEKTSAPTEELGPCPLGKFRNPETNRCKNIETAVSLLKPCDADEFRNPDTNRCNKISSASSSLTPCKPGQERNPATNRCRAVGASASNLKPCDEGEERNPETNRCRKVSVLGVAATDLPTITDVAVENTNGQVNWSVIGIALFATCGYILYEWRAEIARKIQFLKIYR